ncbi:MAG: hypothetical protein CMD18_06800 [Flavobacteriales bacterium]|nr:hypothetical protein [Flavobacteriales bacterium]
MKSCFLLILISFSTLMFGQSGCNSFEYLKTRTFNCQSSSQDSWYKFRAKGASLDFVGVFENKDSLFEYEIYPFADCQKIQTGRVMPLRSVFKNSNLITKEVWRKVIEDGICPCPSCLSKIEINQKKTLKLKQGEFYYLRVLSRGKPFKFTLNFSDFDTLNPIQFSIDSIPFEEIEIGMVYQLKDIFFIPKTSSYLSKSIPELKKLELFLKKHAVLRVQVRGHVNGPAQIKPSFYQLLSDQRAEAIKEFLVTNGVEEKRVDAKGMSNFQMRYPSPKNAYQATQNRRVEIVILAVE